MFSTIKTTLEKAKNTSTKAERDYYVTSAKLAMKELGIDVSRIPEEPHQALSELQKLISQPIPALPPQLPRRIPSIPYSDLFEGIEGLP